MITSSAPKDVLRKSPLTIFGRLAADLRLADVVPRSRERLSARLPLVHEGAEAVDVGPEVERHAAEKLLGRRVLRGAEDEVSAVRRSTPSRSRSPGREMPQSLTAARPTLVEEDVLRLEVPMHDVVLRVRPFESAGDAHERPVEELGIARASSANAGSPPPSTASRSRGACRAGTRRAPRRSRRRRRASATPGAPAGSARSRPCCRLPRESALTAKLGPEGDCRTRAHTPIPPRMTSTTVNTSESNPCVRASAGRESSSPGRKGTTCSGFSHSRPARNDRNPERPFRRKLTLSNLPTEVSMKRIPLRRRRASRGSRGSRRPSRRPPRS